MDHIFLASLTFHIAFNSTSKWSLQKTKYFWYYLSKWHLCLYQRLKVAIYRCNMLGYKATPKTQAFYQKKKILLLLGQDLVFRICGINLKY